MEDEGGCWCGASKEERESPMEEGDLRLRVHSCDANISKTMAFRRNQLTLQCLLSMNQHFRMVGVNTKPGGALFKPHDQVRQPPPGSLSFFLLCYSFLCCVVLCDSACAPGDGSFAIYGHIYFFLLLTVFAFIFICFSSLFWCRLFRRCLPLPRRARECG